MRTLKRLWGALFFLFLGVVSLSACGSDSSGQNAYLPTPSPSIVPDADGDGKIETKELTIDTIDITTKEVVSATAYIPADEEITAEVITREVVESLYNNEILVPIDSVTTKENNVVISFGRPEDGLAFQEDEALEFAVLDSLSYSILDNMDNVSGIIFQIEGESYESENLVLELDEVYTWR